MLLFFFQIPTSSIAISRLEKNVDTWNLLESDPLKVLSKEPKSLFAAINWSVFNIQSSALRNFDV